MNRRTFCQSSLSLATAAALFTTNPALAAMLKVTGDVDAMTATGAQATLKQAAVQELSDALRGPLLLPGNAAYENARLVLNAAIDKHPALIVQPSGEADVSKAVRIARDNQLVVAVLSSGLIPAPLRLPTVTLSTI